MSFTSPGGPKHVTCFTDKSADETYGPWIDARGYANVSFALTGTGTTSGGVITYEECQAVKDTSPLQAPGLSEGNYSVVTTTNASDVTGGVQKVVHFPPNVAYGFVRSRISSAVTGGGTVTSTAELS